MNDTVHVKIIITSLDPKTGARIDSVLVDREIDPKKDSLKAEQHRGLTRDASGRFIPDGSFETTVHIKIGKEAK